MGFPWVAGAGDRLPHGRARCVIIACAGVAALLSASPARAEEALPTAEETPSILVTAQRRPEAIEDVPMSLTVVPGATLERLQINETSGLDRVVPSLVMRRTGAFTQPYLRGIGKRSTLGVENNVATYVDGVYFASSISALQDLRGIERVEVLNGPQGTLFGRNATGGVIQIVTRDPTPEASGEALFHVGTDGYVRGDLYATGGSERLAGNLSLGVARAGGYGTNLFTRRRDQGDVDHSVAVRSRWLLRPAESLRIVLAGDYQDIDQDFSSVPAAGFAPIGAPRVRGFRRRDQDGPSRFRLRYGGASLRAEAELGSLTLMSVSALRRTDARFGFDLDLGPLPLFSGAPDAEQDQFSQELQLLSDEESRLRWVAGLYYIRLEERYEPTTFSYGDSYSAFLGGRIGQTLFANGSANSYAAYGQGIWAIDEATRLTLGLRYTIERRTVEANGERQFDAPPFVRPIPGLPLLGEAPLRDSDTFREWTWRAALDHDLSDHVLAYASASRGFQSGGWNLQTPQNPPFGPERLDAFEAGLRYSDSAQRFRGDANLFYYDYSDIQVSAATPIGSATTNAASAEIYGIEIQASAQLGERTQVTFGGQLLQAKYRDFPNASCVNYSAAAVPYAPITCDVSGNRLPFAPALRFNIGATHRLPIGALGSLLLTGNLAYESESFAEPDNVVRQAPFTTIDVSLEWRPGPGTPSVRLWALNLGSARYSTNLVTFPTAGVLQTPGAPRRIGGSIAYEF